MASGHENTVPSYLQITAAFSTERGVNIFIFHEFGAAGRTKIGIVRKAIPAIRTGDD